ncbi:MAG: ABC transporter permease subunit [Spirochaetales bacterium]|nr:ABC transporter permease subunit [Spirochaetales bacterium]
MKDFISKTRLIGFLSLLLILLLWKLLSFFLKADIILPPPEKAFTVFLAFIRRRAFWAAVGATVLRGAAGFFLSFIAGTLVGLAAGANTLVHAFIRFPLQIIRSTPVMSVILLAVMWFSSDAVPVFVAFLMSFPIVCQNVLQGTLHVDPALLEMAAVYRLSRRDTLLHISFPAVLPYLGAAATATLGLTWKVVIAAEVLSLPLKAVGTGMQFAQINLEAAEVFAWTITAILLSFLSEELMKGITAAVKRKRGGKI